MLVGSEQAVLLPLLLLAGALVKVEDPLIVLIFSAVVFALRLVPRLALAPLFVRSSGAPRASSWPLALGLLPSGAISVVVALEVSRHLPGVPGELVLSVAIVVVLLGELFGPRNLRRAFALAGEEGAAPPSIPSPPPGPNRPAVEGHS